ncbi:MAG: hypothetical protein KJ042_08580 [Deltaproteobacteria bacterium]|nr:hypothetical protein [Deltaproteobacteria bacterium]
MPSLLQIIPRDVFAERQQSTKVVGGFRAHPGKTLGELGRGDEPTARVVVAGIRFQIKGKLANRVVETEFVERVLGKSATPNHAGKQIELNRLVGRHALP